MTEPRVDSSALPAQLAPVPGLDETVERVRAWLAHEEQAEAAGVARSRAAQRGERRLADLLRDPHGLDFTIGFVDRVIRAEDPRVAARNLDALSRNLPAFLPRHLRAAVLAGGGFGLLAPWPVIPIAKRVFRRMVAHLVIDAEPRRLARRLAELRHGGVRLNVNLLGEAVLGEAEAQRRLAGTSELLARDDVDYVSVKVSAVASQLAPWAFPETVDRLVERLAPLYEQAAASPTPTFINLDMEEYRDLDLTVAVFTRLLERPELHGLEAGIVLQAYLPDSLAVLQELTSWARGRVREGGAPIKVRVVKGANLAMERVDALLHGWPLATWPSKQATDANYKRLLDWALRPRNAEVVRVGVAGHNLFDLAWALLLAERRGVAERVDVEMLLGMASAHQDAIRAETGRVLLYTPVVPSEQFDSAIAYLVRRLEENGSGENFMSVAYDLADPEAFAREAGRFEASLSAFLADDGSVPRPARTQNRMTPRLPWIDQPFQNEPDTDPSRPPNRAWARAILQRVPTSELGAQRAEDARITEAAALDALLERAAAAGREWGRTSAADRAAVLHRAGDALADRRAELIEVMAAETGKTLSEADVEVSEAVDLAHYYASLAPGLEAIPEARFEPDGLVVVAPPWNFPVSIPAGGVLAALAAGSAVVLKPAPQARRCGAVLADALWAAGVPRDVLALADPGEGPLGARLVTDDRVGRVVLTGSAETAALFRSWRSDLVLSAETSGKNAIVVTPSADLDLAAADLVRSAFGNAGQKCSAASLGILVGSVADSERFRRQLVDAVRSLVVDWPDDPAAAVGPLVEPPGERLARGLTELGPGERWLVRPRQLDESGRLWSPGVRDGVLPGSEAHLTEFFGPVLGLMRAASLQEAIALQNATDYGLTAGLHSLDPDEIATWADRVEAGNLYVNRPITGAIVRRQPFGGWKRSSVGPGAKAGGPNALLALGVWHPIPVEPDGDLRLDELDERVRLVVEAAQPGMDYAGFAEVRRGAYSDRAAWEELGQARDESRLFVERNVLRHRPVPVEVRLAEGGSFPELVRVIAAGVLAGSRLSVSAPAPLPDALATVLDPEQFFVPVDGVRVESDREWLARLRTGAERPERIRLVGGDRTEVAAALGGSIDTAVWAGPVTAAGRVELLPFLREQAVSITVHRFGHRDPDLAELPL